MNHASRGTTSSNRYDGPDSSAATANVDGRIAITRRQPAAGRTAHPSTCAVRPAPASSRVNGGFAALEPATATPPETISQSPPQLRPAHVPQRSGTRELGSRHLVV